MKEQENKPSVKIMEKDLDLFMSELQVEKYEAMRYLRANGGDLKKSLEQYINL